MSRCITLPIVALCLVLTPALAIPDTIPPVQILPNGLRIVVRERHDTPIVAIDCWIRAGSADEPGEENGCAHFLEHTLFKGTASRAIGAADFEVESLGGVLNASTGADYAHYYTELPSAHAAEAAGVIADIVRNATFPQAEVDRERAVILDELARHNADQMARITDRLYTLSFPAGGYALSPGGEPASIVARDRSTLISFYHRVYLPNRCTLAFAGDITPDSAKQIAETAFGSWQNGPVQPKAAPRKPIHVSQDEDARQGDPEAVGIAYPGPAARNADISCLAQVCAALLGDQKSGGAFSSAKWSGTEVQVRYTPRREESLFTVTARMPAAIPPRPFDPAPKPVFNSLIDLEAAIRSEVTALSTNPPSAAQLAAAIHTVQSRIEYDHETDSGEAMSIGERDLIGGEPPELAMSRLAMIKPADVQLFAGVWLAQKGSICSHSLNHSEASRRSATHD